MYSKKNRSMSHFRFRNLSPNHIFLCEQKKFYKILAFISACVKMGKTKSEDELLRFVWKRNLKYDLQLLCEVESQNPYASDKPKEVWTLIAKILREGALKMKVTERSCRERVNELLKNHRKNELKSLQA